MSKNATVPLYCMLLISWRGFVYYSSRRREFSSRSLLIVTIFEFWGYIISVDSSRRLPSRFCIFSTDYKKKLIPMMSFSSLDRFGGGLTVDLDLLSTLSYYAYFNRGRFYIYFFIKSIKENNYTSNIIDAIIELLPNLVSLCHQCLSGRFGVVFQVERVNYINGLKYKGYLQPADCS